MLRARALVWTAAVLIAVPAAHAHGGVPALTGSSNATSVVTLAPGDEIFPGGFEQMFSLAIDDILAWCDVSVNGGAPTSAPPVSSFEKGRVIPLHGDTADANYFVWGFWTETDGGAMDTNMDTTVTMSADKSITVCCPDIGFATCP